jgi:hypothetical protein
MYKMLYKMQLNKITSTYVYVIHDCVEAASTLNTFDDFQTMAFYHQFLIFNVNWSLTLNWLKAFLFDRFFRKLW